jgi:hypothetical protein
LKWEKRWPFDDILGILDAKREGRAREPALRASRRRV